MRWVVTTACLVVSGGLVLVFLAKLPPQVPLWYSRPWGEDQLAQPVFLWIIPIGILILGGISEVVRRGVKDKVLETLLTGAVAGAQIILAVGLVRIITLVV
ncbi:MAG: hypothetical protein G01um101416_983 [Microgenomates group bacterium Gr01-1014_16]|nr:MAG: hypothetical protein G01um101416_983 [Microgenomates group bacterium Gr01-1014_16]